MATPRRVALLLIFVVVVPTAVGPGAAAVAPTDAGDAAVAPSDAGDAANAPGKTSPAVETVAVHAGVADGNSETEAAATSGTIDIETRLSLTPDRPGSIRARTRVSVPDNVVDLTLTLEGDATVVGTDGFDATADGSLDWDGETRPATVTYTLPANRTGQSRGPEGAAGEYLFADVGDWALVETPDVGVSYRFRGDVSVAKTVGVEGEGVVGNAIAYLGAARETTTAAHGQTVHLVEPRAAELAADREAVFAAVASASDALRVGDRDESVYMFAAPTSVDWGVEGLQVGDTDFYVTADEPLDEPANTWLHEYVHTRQNLSLAPDAKWFSEASATYYAALLTLEGDRIEYEAFRDALAIGTRDRYDDVVLAEQATWAGGGEYFKGALVAGELDRRLRLATDSSATLQAVFSAMNGDPDFDGAALLRVLERRGGSDIRRAGERFTTTTDTPAVWSPQEHQAAFGQVPARIEASLPATTNRSAWRVAGPYRTGPVSPTVGRFVPGESLTVAVPIRNAGGTAGPYGIEVRLGGRTVERLTGTVAADTTRWRRVTVPLEAIGDNGLAVGGESVRIRVAQPASLTTRSLSVNRSTVQPGDAVRVTVAVANDADLPGESTVSVAADGGVLDSRTVRLGPGATRTLALDVRFDSPGERTLTVGNRSADVTVSGDGRDGTDGPNGSSGTGAGTTGADGTGFGPSVPLLALVGLAILGWRRSGAE
jgi:hypothetical protein